MFYFSSTIRHQFGRCSLFYFSLLGAEVVIWCLISLIDALRVNKKLILRLHLNFWQNIAGGQW